MFDRFTERARKVMTLARQEAQRFKHDYIGTEHILLGLVQEGSGVAAQALKNLDLDPKRIRVEVEKVVKPGTNMVTMGQLPFAKEAKRALELALEEAQNLGHKHIGTEHILLGVIRESYAVAAQVLQNLGANLEVVREGILELLGADTGDGARPDVAEALESASDVPTHRAPGRSRTPALDAYGRDLTELAREGQFNPVIGREREIERVMQVLSRRTKNNPVLIGSAGVGKTAIVEGLAQLMVSGRVPASLRSKRVMTLDLAMMVAGTKYRGQFEERIKAVMTDVRRAKDVLLFIDELHTLVGAGGAEGAIDASNVLKPALSRGEVQCIGATTLDEYRKHIETDAALERRFQTIVIEPPSTEQTFEILRALRERYEQHHAVRYTDDALRAAVELGTLYLTHRHLPDTAIDVIDEAGAQVHLADPHVSSAPATLDEIETRIRTLDAEKAKAVAEQDFEKAARIRDQWMKAKKKRQEELDTWRAMSPVDQIVDVADVARAVARLTGIELERIERREPLPRTGSAAAPASGVAKYEHDQTESVLHGSGVAVRPGTGFVLLPHTEEFQEIFDVVIAPAMGDHGIVAMKADDIFRPGSILNQVWDAIRSAEVIVADVSDRNPNVIYELGLCYGVRRCPILLVRNPGELPFNLRSLRYIEYTNSAAGAAELRRKLSNAIAEFLAAVRTTAPPPGGPV